MFLYYLDRAWRSFRRDVGLTLLMVVAIGVGVGASMTTLTVLHVLSADPIPEASHQLYAVQVDPRPKAGMEPGEEPADQLTRTDAEALLRAARGKRQAMMSGGSAAIEADHAGLAPFRVDARWTSSDFFPMFRAPFAAGGPWSAADDAASARVVVITRALAEKLFGQVDVVGRAVRVEGGDLRIVGVLDTWRVNPHFYDLHTDVYGAGEQVFAPFSTSRELSLKVNGTLDCWDTATEEHALGAPCVWIQFWVELDSEAAASAYRDFLVSYSQEQLAAGRFQRAPNVRLRDVPEWLDFQKVVPSDAQFQNWIALGFLFVCLINTVGLLLTKFLRHGAELGVRRAVGASKRSIFAQLLVEAGIVGLAGGALGLGLAYLGLWAVRQQPTEYAELAHLDLPMLFATIALAVVSSICAGLLPAWRGCQLAPAIQLKSH